MEIKDNNLLRWLARRPNIYQKDQIHYYLFYREAGYNTSESFRLKEEIESLIQNGYLKEFVNKLLENLSSKSKKKAATNDQRPFRKIRTIFDGPVGGGYSKRIKTQALQSRIQVSIHIIYAATFNQTMSTLNFKACEAQVFHQPWSLH